DADDLAAVALRPVQRQRGLARGGGAHQGDGGRAGVGGHGGIIGQGTGADGAPGVERVRPPCPSAGPALVVEEVENANPVPGHRAFNLPVHHGVPPCIATSLPSPCSPPSPRPPAASIPTGWPKPHRHRPRRRLPTWRWSR